MSRGARKRDGADPMHSFRSHGPGARITRRAIVSLGCVTCSHALKIMKNECLVTPAFSWQLAAWSLAISTRETCVTSCSRCGISFGDTAMRFQQLAPCTKMRLFFHNYCRYGPMAKLTSVADIVVIRLSWCLVTGQNGRAFGALWFFHFCHPECTPAKNHDFRILRFLDTLVL